jgi:formylglycine-generating enzyme required for sulfatase activity
MMGSPDSDDMAFDIEKPQHEVTISQGFYLGKYELMQGQWQSVMDTRPWAGRNYVQENSSHPAVYISWDDVQELISRLNEAEGDSVYRLPTEAEWEYACRAGTTTRWSFGDDESLLGEYAWYWDNAMNVGEQYAHAAGLKLPNPWGLYDMHGNLYEWCLDWYGEDYYSVSPSIDPGGPASSLPLVARVARGGSFYDTAGYARSAYRYYDAPTVLRYHTGARLVREEPQ